MRPATIVAAVACVMAAHATADDAKPYTVVDGYKVDANTMNGFRAWRAAACDRCHGASQQGLVGPSLLESFKKLSREDFVKTVTDGRLDKGMPSFNLLRYRRHDGSVFLYAFDLIELNGDDLRREPLKVQVSYVRARISPPRLQIERFHRCSLPALQQ